ncbi:MAG: protein-glutamate O-methyltransferase CheR [Candidatus Cloacimonetes bacterium]|nr:protein-glutamate O-methyltransferase CheR [Candidatus Cloacimonadota bacterium]
MTIANYQINDHEFEKIRKLVYQEFGINLTEKKKLLVVNRLQKVLKQNGLKSFSEYFEYIKADKTNTALSELVNKISTNHTFFYRESAHFEQLRNERLPQIVETLSKIGNKDLRVWCAGSSSGEESSTIMMIIKDVLGSDYSSWKAGLLATDICEDVLKFAKVGIYDTDKIAALPVDLRNKYVEKVSSTTSKIKREVLGEITYRKFNLMHSFPFKKQFHVIFCRNVMIYFDQVTREALVKRFMGHLVEGGLLFIGHSESLSEVEGLVSISPSLYRKGTS